MNIICDVKNYFQFTRTLQMYAETKTMTHLALVSVFVYTAIAKISNTQPQPSGLGSKSSESVRLGWLSRYALVYRLNAWAAGRSTGAY